MIKRLIFIFLFSLIPIVVLAAGTKERCDPDQAPAFSCPAGILAANDMEDDTFSETFMGNGSWKGGFLDSRQVSAYPAGAEAHLGAGVMRLLYREGNDVCRSCDVTMSGSTATCNSCTWTNTPLVNQLVVFYNTVSNNTLKAGQWSVTGTPTSSAFDVNITFTTETNTTTGIKVRQTGPGFEEFNYTAAQDVYHRWYGKQDGDFLWREGQKSQAYHGDRAGQNCYLFLWFVFTTKLEFSTQNCDDLEWQMNQGKNWFSDAHLDEWVCYETRVRRTTINGTENAEGIIQLYIDNVLRLSYVNVGIFGASLTEEEPNEVHWISGYYNESTADPWGVPDDGNDQTNRLMHRWEDDHVWSSSRIGCLDGEGESQDELSTVMMDIALWIVGTAALGGTLLLFLKLRPRPSAPVRVVVKEHEEPQKVAQAMEQEERELVETGRD